MLLSVAHFPPIHYFTKVVDLDSFFIESKEHYQKQSYRNRFRIFAANGPLDLSIPIIRGRTPGQLIREVKVDSAYSWQRNHLKTIQAAYRHSPFYEFYFDEFQPYWEKKWTFLYDLNLHIMFTLLDLLELNIEIIETTDYQDILPEGKPDYRELIHPKRPWEEDPQFRPWQYTQNFSDRHGFQANLSIIDLIFQCGPEAVNVLRESNVLLG